MRIKREKCTKGLARDKALALRPLTACVMLAVAQLASANPTGPQVAAGAASIQASGNSLTVTNTPGTILNWQSFSIAPGELTRFIQQSAGSAVLNRVIAANPSAILGTLSSNGRVFLVNPHGIVIGAGALIDTAGFVGSTLNIADKDFLAGRLKFEGGGAGVLRNEGTIQATSDIFLVGPQIENAGIIRSAAGDVVLAAGKSVTITSPDAHGVQFGIQAPTDSVLNLGSIQAGNAVGLFAGTLKHSGQIHATTARLDSAGRVVLSAQKDAIVDGNATISVDNAVGKGGSVQVLGERVGIFDQGTITARGAAGGGEILIGGDFRGANPDVRNSLMTWVGPDAKLDASATSQGDGGKVILWANDTTRAHGHISVRGGSLGGNGGLVETSGKRYLAATRTPDVSAPRGSAGEWLLDPSTITFDATPGSTNISAGDPWRPDDGNLVSRVEFDLLRAAVETGATVTVDTTAEANNGAGGGGVGDIIFNVPAIFTPPAGGARLVLKAHNNIQLLNGLTKVGANNLVVQFVPDQDLSGAGAATITGITSPDNNLALEGTFRVRGTLGSFDIPLGAVGTFDAGVAMNVTGTVNVFGTSFIRNHQTGATVDSNNGVINIKAGGTLTQEYNTDWTVLGGTPRLNIENGGTFTKNIAGTNSINWLVNNQGTLRVQQGRLNINPAGFTSVSSAPAGQTATLQSDTGATLDLSATTTGVHELGDNVLITGGGTFAYSGTSNTLRTTGTTTGVTIAPGASFTLNNKTLGGTANSKLTNNGSLTLVDSGTMNGILINQAALLIDGSLGTAAVNGGLTLTSGTATINNGRSLTTTGGALNWAGGTLSTPGTATINVGAFNVTTVAPHELGAGLSLTATTTAIANGATLTKSNGTLNPGIFNNDGTFNVTAIGQNLPNGGASTGVFNSGAGLQIAFTGGTHTLTGAVLNGPGNYDVTGGTLNLVNLGSATTNIDVFSNQSIVNLTGSTLTGTVDNDGSIHALAGSSQLTGPQLNAGAGGVLDIAAGATLGATNFNWQNGTLIGGGTFNVSGAFGIAGTRVVNGPTFNVTGNTTVLAGQTLQLTSGALNINGGGSYAGTLLADVGTTITLLAGVHPLNGATLSGVGTIVNNGGTLNVTAPVTADISQFTQAAGSLNLIGQPFTKDGGLFSFDGGTINVNGALNMTNGAVFRTTGAGVKTLAGNNTVTGNTFHLLAGTLLMQGTPAVTASGVVTIDAGATWQIDGGSLAPAAAFNNAGIFSLNTGTVNLPAGGTQTGVFNVATGAALDFTGGTHVINGAQLNGAGDYVHSGGVFNVTGSSAANGAQFDHSGGSIVLAAGATFTKDSGAFDWIASGINGPGTLTMTNGAVLNVSGGTPKFLNGPTLNAGVLNLNSGSLGVQNGALNVSGATTIAAPASLQITGGTFSPAAAFSNAGIFTVNAGTVNLPGGGTHSGTFNVGSVGTLDFTGGTHTLNGAQLNGLGTYVNSAGLLNVVGPTAANGALFFQSGGTLNVAAGQTFTKNTGILHWMGGQFSGPGTVALTTGATLDLSGNGARMFNGPTLNADSLNLTAGTLTVQSGSLTASGPVGVAAGSALQILGGTLTTQGTFDVSGSVVNNATINNTNPITIAAGSLGGTGTFNGSIVNNGGTVGPGTSPGTMTINGDYTQGPSGTLAIDLAGTQPGVDHDLLRVSGAANLAGTLDVRHSGTYVPQGSESYTFMTYASRNGDFANFVYPPNFAYTPAAGAVSYVVSLAGSSMNPNATNDVLALKENQKTSDEMLERVEDDEKRKIKGAVCR